MSKIPHGLAGPCPNTPPPRIRHTEQSQTSRSLGLSCPPPLHIRPHPCRERLFLDPPRSKTQHRLRRIFLRRNKTISIQFEKQHAHHKTGPFISINKRMIPDNPSRISSRHLNHVRPSLIRAELLRPGQRGLQQALIAQTRRPAFERKQAIVQRHCITLVDPDRLFHLASTCRVLRYRRTISSAFFIFFSKAGSYAVS